MIDFNPFLTYYLGRVVSEAVEIESGVQLRHYLEDIVRWKGMLRTMISHGQYRIFPDTRACVEEILRLLSALVPDEPGVRIQNRALLIEETTSMMMAVNELTNTFQRECQRTFVAALERQRAFDTYTLVDSISTAFSVNTWKRLSARTKGEIRESGLCLAFERYTSAGFHALRAIEYEVKDYIQLLLRAVPKKRDLGYYIDILKQHSANSKLVSTLESIRSLDRNPLMHPEDWLEIDDAVAMFCLAQTALDRLVADMESKELLPPQHETAPPA
jgi:hypothetical protein